MVAKLASGTNEDDRKDLKSQREFIIAVSAVDTACEIFNIIALFVIMRPRSGATIAISRLSESIILPWEPVTNISLLMAVLLFSILFTAVIAYFLTLYIGKKFALLFNVVPYKKLTITVIIFLFVMLFLFSGPVGVLIALFATCIGMLPPLLGVSRAHLMGCLLFPVILFYLGLDSAVLKFMGVG
jgi:putative membrane protein